MPNREEETLLNKCDRSVLNQYHSVIFSIAFTKKIGFNSYYFEDFYISTNDDKGAIGVSFMSSHYQNKVSPRL